MHHVYGVENGSMCMWGMSQISLPLCKNTWNIAVIQVQESNIKNITKCESVPLHSAQWHQSLSWDTTWLSECAIPSWVLMHHSTMRTAPYSTDSSQYGVE